MSKHIAERDFQPRYYEAVRELFTDPAYPPGPNPLRGLGTLPPEEVLDLLEKEILAAADLGDGIDPVLMLALDLPDPLSVPAYNRRTSQIVAASGTDTATWVTGRTKAEFAKQTAIGKGRLALLCALDQIEQSVIDAGKAVIDLSNAYDPQMLSGPAPIMLTNALDQIRLLTAGAATFAPRLDV